MKSTATGLRRSATDLGNFLACRHRTALDMAVALGTRTRPQFEDPLREILAQRGAEHEQAYVNQLRDQGRSITSVSQFQDDAVRLTIDAMRAGVDVIVQAALGGDQWFGYPDVLERVSAPSELGPWSYEAVDTKLARETKAQFLLQLCLYSELIAEVQGRMPRHFHLVTPDPVEPRRTYRVDDYAAYFRLVKSQLDATTRRDPDQVFAENYPEPVDFCDVCDWSRECVAKRRQDDHLSLVAWSSRTSRRELARHGIETLTALAGIGDPLPFRPKQGSSAGYLKLRDQARLQLASRDHDPPLHQLLHHVPGLGLGRLPAPSPGDVFLDLEGDPFAREGGREYLFGLATVRPDGSSEYRSYWALDDREERVAFEAVMDFIMERWAADPGAHVYHYAPYEPAAFKRLMGRYASRADDLDRLLRGGRFVDLYGVVRQGLQIGVERYSIKNLEPLYRFNREVPLIEANRSLRALEAALELNDISALTNALRAPVEGYNRDDCVSTLRLREWLEERRTELVARGAAVERPLASDGQATQEQSEASTRVAALREQLLDGVAPIAAERDAGARARWVLAYLLDWHHRESKAGWWEYFRLRDLPEEDLFDEPKALAKLEFVGRVGLILRKDTKKPTRSVVDRYRFPPQEWEIGVGDELRRQGEIKTEFGKVVAVDRDANTVDVWKGRSRAEIHPTAVFEHTWVPTKVFQTALMQIGERVLAQGLVVTPGSADRAARDLLLRSAPRLIAGAFDGSDPSVEALCRLVAQLDDSVLAVQGPPGAGKTYSGARMICALARAGKRVGVTATSHKVIDNLLGAVEEAAREAGMIIRLGHKRKEDDLPVPQAKTAKMIAENDDAARALATGQIDVLGGTGWVWAAADLANSVDVLFIDEAGQMSLASALAVSVATKSLVLLGDPRQLDQPMRGSHPDGVGVSALEHFLDGHLTMPPERGIFLPVTRRLAPPVCDFISEAFYESKLHPIDGLERQRVSGAGELDGAGLRVVTVDHDGNRSASDEEVQVVASLVGRLTTPGITWTDEKGMSRPLAVTDILVVAPYNAQVSRLRGRLEPLGVKVGTVDKFQGQEAPVVIYSMATSRPEDAPRGMEFLYSQNRLNVALSRAKALAIVVASPWLFEPECRSPRQMKLANALCRFRELAATGLRPTR